MDEVMPTNTVAAAPPIAKITVRVEMVLVGSSWKYKIVADDVASDPYVENEIIKVPNGPETKIEFKLQGSAAGKLDFKESDPIWIHEANSCPGSRCSDPDICIIEVKKNKLEINDRNTKGTDLYYMLNFVDGNGKEHSCDPIIRNGGGGP